MPSLHVNRFTRESTLISLKSKEYVANVTIDFSRRVVFILSIYPLLVYNQVFPMETLPGLDINTACICPAVPTCYLCLAWCLYRCGAGSLVTLPKYSDGLLVYSCPLSTSRPSECLAAI